LPAFLALEVWLYYPFLSSSTKKVRQIQTESKEVQDCERITSTTGKRQENVNRKRERNWKNWRENK
jgi:hypothetical protein